MPNIYEQKFFGKIVNGYFRKKKKRKIIIVVQLGSKYAFIKENLQLF